MKQDGAKQGAKQGGLDGPDDGESYSDFMDRCVSEGNDEDDCQLAWEEERSFAVPIHKVHVSKRGPDLGDFEFVLSDDSPDRMGDIVTSTGWDTKQFERNPIALFNHNKDLPIGRWTKIGVNKHGELRGVLDLAKKGTSPRIDEIRSLVEQGILRAVSVGFLPREHSRIQKGEKGPALEPLSAGTRFIKQELLEASLVAVPANSNALRVVKSLGISDATKKIVLIGDQGDGTRKSAGAVVKVHKVKEAGMAKKSIAEQISGFEATRASKHTKMMEIMEKSDEKGETLDAAQQDSYDELVNEVKSLDAHLDRLRVLEKSSLTKAVEVRGGDVIDAARSRNGGESPTVRVEMRSRVPKGILFARHFIAKTYAQLNNLPALDAARKFGYFDETPELEDILKAAVAVGTTTDTAWAGPLVVPTPMASEFIELLKPLTIIGRIPGLRRVPFNIKIPREITAASVSWVGEGKPKPVSAMAFDSISLGFTKVAGIVPVTEELFRFSNPAIETLVRDSLLDAVALLTDRDFLDPAKIAVAGVSPASVTNGVTPVTPSGTTGDALRADLGTILGQYASANMSLNGLVLVMTSTQAVRISLMRTALGTTEFVGITPQGGSLEGIPVITSENIVHTGGSPSTGSLIVALNAPEILLADDGAVTVDMSREASLQMDSAPDDPTSGSTVMVSLWQRNMVALRAERMINWMKRRAGAVHYITNANYA